MSAKFSPPTVIRPAKNGKTQVIRSHARWSDAAEERFLRVLAGTCNVRAAAAAAGFSTVTVYNRRKRLAGFEREWNAAIAQGYARLEARLLELATESLAAPGDRDGDCEGADGEGDRADCEGDGADCASNVVGPAMTVAEATNLLRLHRASVRGGAPQNFDWRRAAPDPDAARASIRRKIEAIRRARGRAGPA